MCGPTVVAVFFVNMSTVALNLEVSQCTSHYSFGHIPTKLGRQTVVFWYYHAFHVWELCHGHVCAAASKRQHWSSFSLFSYQLAVLAWCACHINVKVMHHYVFMVNLQMISDDNFATILWVIAIWVIASHWKSHNFRHWKIHWSTAVRTRLELELRLLNDVALIGMPNAGKTSLLVGRGAAPGGERPKNNQIRGSLRNEWSDSEIHGHPCDNNGSNWMSACQWPLARYSAVSHLMWSFENISSENVPVIPLKGGQTSSCQMVFHCLGTPSNFLLDDQAMRRTQKRLTAYREEA